MRAEGWPAGRFLQNSITCHLHTIDTLQLVHFFGIVRFYRIFLDPYRKIFLGSLRLITHNFIQPQKRDLHPENLLVILDLNQILYVPRFQLKLGLIFPKDPLDVICNFGP